MSWTRQTTERGFTAAQRRAILDRSPECECRGCPLCDGLPCSRGSAEADHRLNRAEAYRLGIDSNTIDNGQALCIECHHHKTSGEKAAGQARTRAKLKHPSARK